MGVITDMKKLSEDIVASTDMREKKISDLVNTTHRIINDTHRMMRDIRADHKEMVDNLRASLDKWETARAKDYRIMMGDIGKAIKEIRMRRGEIHKEVHNLMHELHSRSGEMSSIWRKLSQTMSEKRRTGQSELQTGGIKKKTVKRGKQE